MVNESLKLDIVATYLQLIKEVSFFKRHSVFVYKNCYSRNEVYDEGQYREKEKLFINTAALE